MVWVSGEMEVEDNEMIELVVNDCGLSDIMDKLIENNSTEDILSYLDETEVLDWAKTKTVEKI